MDAAPWWISPLLTLVGFGVGIGGAAWIQDRNRRVANRAAARALRADLKRIDGELGPNEGIEFLGSFAGIPTPPTLHAWITPSIANLVDEDERIIPVALVLERDLANFGGAAIQALAIRRNQRESKDRLLEMQTRERPKSIAESFAVGTQEWQKENEIQSFSERYERAVFALGVSHKRCLDGIEEMITLLDPIADRVIPLVPWGHAETFE